MRRIVWKRLLFGLWILAQFSLFLCIPVLGASVFLSPDETAVAVGARSVATTLSMRMEDSLLKEAPWLHPRSFVTQGTSIVPVGFLGMSLLVGIVWRIVGEMGLALFTPLLALSVIFPLWHLAKKSGRTAQVITIVTWMSFPAVILYANRGLFANLPVVCLTVWSVYLLLRSQKTRDTVLAGICVGLALAIRPVEGIWMIPWIAYAWWKREQNMPKDRATYWLDRLAIALGVLLPISIAFFVAWRTYGSPFMIGYWLRDPQAADLVRSVASIGGRMPSAPTMVRTFLPFGFHPRNVWFNFQSYVLTMLGPWFAVGIVGAFIAWKKKESRAIVYLSVWTIVSLAFLYGEGIYQDHVGINVSSVGNSYLRYLLPIAPLVALAAGVCGEWLRRRWSGKRGFVFAIVLSVGLIGLGTWTACWRDDEGLATTTIELMRYRVIRQTAQQETNPRSIILSDRSDKIFFPTFRVASPLPSFDVIKELVDQSPVPVLLYSSVLDDSRLETWKRYGMTLRPLFQSDREMLYQLVSVPKAPVL